MSDKTLRIKATIEVEGPAEEVTAWLSKLPGGSTTTKQTSAIEWNEEIAYRLVRRISGRALEALALIAAATIQGGSISFETLQRQMRLDGVALGGVFASFGFAERAGFPRPFDTDHGHRTYSMDPDVARMMIRAIERYEDEG
jgi:hypothetical protein